MKLIGLCGLISSGKDTVAQYMRTSLGPSWQGPFLHMSFAGPLKDTVSSVFGWHRELLEGYTEQSRVWRETPDPFWTEKLGTQWTPRLALQRIGTEVFRDNFDSSIWINSLEKKILECRYSVVVSDVRFPNEIAMIRRLQGEVWRVKRGPDPAWFEVAQRTLRGEREDNGRDMHALYPHIHYSEWAWANETFDRVVENDGTLDDLQQKVKALLGKTG